MQRAPDRVEKLCLCHGGAVFGKMDGRGDFLGPCAGDSKSSGWAGGAMAMQDYVISVRKVS